MDMPTITPSGDSRGLEPFRMAGSLRHHELVNSYGVDAARRLREAQAAL